VRSHTGAGEGSYILAGKEFRANNIRELLILINHLDTMGIGFQVLLGNLPRSCKGAIPAFAEGRTSGMAAATVDGHCSYEIV
jgi:hypothetical protein